MLALVMPLGDARDIGFVLQPWSLDRIKTGLADMQAAEYRVRHISETLEV